MHQGKTGSIASRLLVFSIPLILSGILQQLYSWADAFIVGLFVGEDALAAVGVTTTISHCLIQMITGFTLFNHFCTIAQGLSCKSGDAFCACFLLKKETETG